MRNNVPPIVKQLALRLPTPRPIIVSVALNNVLLTCLHRGFSVVCAVISPWIFLPLLCALLTALHLSSISNPLGDGLVEGDGGAGRVPARYADPTSHLADVGEYADDNSSM